MPNDYYGNPTILIHMGINLKRYDMEFKITDKHIGGKSQVFVVAELSANHLQKYDLAAETIKAMKEAGADAVKL